jgi:tetratricopeptide (TPR) repeat protein
MVTPTNYVLKMPRGRKAPQLGFVGDLIMGAAGGLCVFAATASLLGYEPPRAGATAVIEAMVGLRACAVALLAGFAGQTLVTQLAGKLTLQMVQLQERVHNAASQSASYTFVQQGNYHFQNGRWEQAVGFYDKAIATYDGNVDAMLNKAMAKKRLGATLEALSLVSAVLALEPENDRAWYNGACYKAILGRPVEEIVTDLRKAIQLVPRYREIAASDEDFRRVANEPRFRELVGSKQSG